MEKNEIKNELSHSNYIEELTPVHVTNNIEPDDINSVLRALAAFERITFEMTDEEKAVHPTGFFAEMYAIVFTEKSLEAAYVQLEKFFGNEMAKEMQKIREYMPLVMETENLERLDNLSQELGMTPVLVHGDLWAPNTLWTNKDRHYKFEAIIDFQTANIGCAAVDLARLFCSLLGGKERKDNWESLLEKFYEYVKEKMKDNIPYTLEQLKEAYHLVFPLAAFFVAFGLPSMLGNTTDSNNAEKDKTIELVMEKAKGLIYDFIAEFERNETNPEKQIIS